MLHARCRVQEALSDLAATMHKQNAALLQAVQDQKVECSELREQVQRLAQRETAGVPVVELERPEPGYEPYLQKLTEQEHARCAPRSWAPCHG